MITQTEQPASPPSPDRSAGRAASRSRFFGGKGAVAVDRARNGVVAILSAALFTQSNARILLGHAAKGMLRFTVANATGDAWSKATVHVTCPTAYSYAVPIGLGALPSPTRTAAPFWIRPRQGAARR